MGTRGSLSGHRARFVMLVAVALCLAWTSWLVCLTLAPNATINQVMHTRELDSGLFWLFGDPPASARILGAVGMAGVVSTHTCILAVLIRHYWSLRQSAPVHAEAIRPASQTQNSSSSRLSSVKIKSFLGSVLRVSDAVLDPESRQMRLTAVVLKFADLALQCVLLVQLMNNGLAPFLIVLFAACIVCNALSTAAIVSISHRRNGVTHLVTDFTFDLFVAVVFPMLVLVNAFLSFSFDRELMAINISVFPIGSFEHAASVIANPVEIMRIHFAIDTLRITSLAKVFTRVGTNLALCYHSYKLARILERDRNHVMQPSPYPSQNRLLGAFFVAVAVAVVVFTERSLTTSTAACAPHPECALIARAWVVNLKAHEVTRCPCLAVIDRDITVARFEDWIRPPNRTEKIAQLATSGHLQAIQLVNRELSYLPEQLRRCHDLRHISLYYTGNLTLPDWFRDFTKLEFLHIEATGPLRSLQPLQEGLFDRMQSLALIHLASHPIPRLPSFDNVGALKSINLAANRKLETLPRFDALLNLERLVLNSMTSLQTIPSLDHAHKVNTFISFDRGAYCCNGFLGSDRCNLSHSLCKAHPIFKTPAVTQCLPPSQQATEATRAVFDRFWQTACYGEALRPGERKSSPTRIEMELCNGMMYRECRLPGSTTSAMCYNARWMGVACDPTPFSIEMRRLQIAQRRGTPCDPKYETWLGCNKT